MSLGYTPAVEITGANAGLINGRLIDWEYVDAAGVQSDTLKLTVNTEGLDGLPSVDGKIGLRRGYKESGMVEAGEFIVTRMIPQLFPSQLQIIATAAPFKVADETDFKARKSASFGPTTLGAVFRELTARHGFSPRIAADLDAIQIEHVDQSNETDMGFLTRLARQHDAVTKPVNDLYVMARRGQLKSLSGKSLPVMTIAVTKDNRPGDAAFIQASLDDDSRVKFKGCRTTWWDGASGRNARLRSARSRSSRCASAGRTNPRRRPPARVNCASSSAARTRCRSIAPGILAMRPRAWWCSMAAGRVSCRASGRSTK